MNDTTTAARPLHSDQVPTPSGTSASTSPAARSPWWITAGWMVHWAIRYSLAGIMLVYGWSKVFLGQFGVLDFSNSLGMYGEMSPMGLFWRFFGYSEFVQITSGVLEVLAAALLLFGRTAWLGGVLMTGVCAAVFAFNLAYDIPVKQNSLAYLVMAVLVVVPFTPALARTFRGLFTGRGAPPLPLPRPVPWPRVRKVTRWTGGALAVLLLVASALVFLPGFVLGRPAPIDSPLPGVYRVTEDAREPAAQLAEDSRWQMVSFGAHGRTPRDAEARGLSDGAVSVSMELRTANGDYRSGVATIDGDALHLELTEPRRGDVGILEPRETRFDLTWSAEDDGRIALRGEMPDGTPVDLVLSPNAEARYLHDNEMHWMPVPSKGAINR